MERAWCLKCDWEADSSGGGVDGQSQRHARSTNHPVAVERGGQSFGWVPIGDGCLDMVSICEADAAANRLPSSSP